MNKIKALELLDKDGIMMYLILILVAISSFFLGRLSVDTIDKSDSVQILTSNINPSSVISSSYSAKAIVNNVPNKVDIVASPQNAVLHKYIASKNGKLYYRVGCGAGKRIVAQNQVFFSSAELAERAGYKPSSSCTP